MKLLINISFCILCMSASAQIDVSQLIIRDSLVKHNYTTAELYQIENADTILREKIFFNSSGFIDSKIEIIDLIGFEDMKAVKLENLYPPNRIEYKYKNGLLIQKMKYLMDTIPDHKYEYSYNSNGQLIREDFKVLPNGRESQTFFKYKNGIKIFEIDTINKRGYKYVLDTLGFDKVSFNLFKTGEITQYDYFDKNGSFTAIDMTNSNVSIVIFNNLKLPAIEIHSTDNNTEAILRYTYQNGLIVKFETIHWYDDGLALKETKLIQYNSH